jgi:hypothetical protein
MRLIQFIEEKKLVFNNPCTEATCQNGGTCYAENLINIKCFCQQDFDGRNCEIDKRPTTTTTSTTSTTTTITNTTTSTTTTNTTTTERYSKLKKVKNKKY